MTNIMQAQRPQRRACRKILLSLDDIDCFQTQPARVSPPRTPKRKRTEEAVSHRKPVKKRITQAVMASRNMPSEPQVQDRQWLMRLRDMLPTWVQDPVTYTIDALRAQLYTTGQKALEAAETQTYRMPGAFPEEESAPIAVVALAHPPPCPQPASFRPHVPHDISMSAATTSPRAATLKSATPPPVSQDEYDLSAEMLRRREWEHNQREMMRDVDHVYPDRPLTSPDDDPCYMMSGALPVETEDISKSDRGVSDAISNEDEPIPKGLIKKVRFGRIEIIAYVEARDAVSSPAQRSWTKTDDARACGTLHRTPSSQRSKLKSSRIQPPRGA